MRAGGTVGVVVTLALLVADSSAKAPARDSAQRPPRELRTPWPTIVDCPRFDLFRVRVDDSIGEVRWSDGTGAILPLAVTRPPGGQSALTFRKGSDLSECDFPSPVPCIVYRPRVGPQFGCHDASGERPAADDIVRSRPERITFVPAAEPPSRFELLDVQHGFGLHLSLRCAEHQRASLEWYCDRSSCLPRTSREGRIDESALAFFARWYRGERRDELARMLRARTDVVRARRAALDAMARDLLTDCDHLITLTCAGACSKKVGELRAVIGTILKGGPLTVIGVRGRRSPEVDELNREARGWEVRLSSGSAGALGLACASQRSALPDRHGHNYVSTLCRLSIFKGGRLLADYVPDAGLSIELPDGGAIHPRGFQLIGSALATTESP